jgi:phage tail-like protein
LSRRDDGWAGARAGLDVDAGGALGLALLPGAAGGVAVAQPGPYDPSPPLEAFAAGPCGEIVFGVRTDRSLVLVDTRCADRRLRLAADDECAGDAAFASISGLAAARARLYVADESAARVLAFTLPALELRWSLRTPFLAPRRVALDNAGRLYVLDSKLQRIVRLDHGGRSDTGYDTGQVAQLADALDLFVTASGAAFVSVAGEGGILCFSSAGAPLAALAPPPDAPGMQPGTLAGDAQRLYVADRDTGAVWVYDLAAKRWLARLPGFRAPVTGLAADGDGHLYVRTGADTAYLRLDAAAAYASSGLLEAGPLDAGARAAWLRVRADADVPAGTRVVIETALGVSDKPTAPLAWRTVDGLDALLHPLAPADVPPDPAQRFLWLRVHLESDDPARSPRLRQLTVETPGDDLLARLPAVYARRDADDAAGFLRNLLASFSAEMDDRDRDIAELARRFDPDTAPADSLEWLSSWVAFDLPAGSGVAERRALLLDAHRLYGRRGTLAGLREMVRLCTGVDCEIVESFRSRRLWALGGPARLGFDTGLLPVLPDGMVVPGPSLPDPNLQGLSEEFFLDDALAEPSGASAQGGDRRARREPAPSLLEPDGGFPFFAVPSAPAGRTLRAFSALWTGQVRARYSELTAFHFAHDGGARVFVDGQLLIDSWISPGKREPLGHLPLVAGRWYDLRIEYWSDDFKAVSPRLSWSSRSQPKEIVPRECLYAVSDDNVDPGARRTDGSPEPLVVGETVVGAHGPLTAEDFGAPLFADSAHHFTVRVYAGAVLAAGKLDAVRAVLDAEKPAYTDYHLCVVVPTFLVGTQARVGIDAFVAPSPPPGRYGEGELGVDARLGISSEHDDGTLRVAETLRIGSDTILR